MAAHRAVAPARQADPGTAEAVERQIRAMRELSRRAFPEPDTSSDDQPAPLEAASAQRRDPETTRALALRRARTERNRARMGGTDTETEE